MTKPEIIGSARSSYTRVVRMVCQEKGIDYELTETLLGAAEIRALHPFAKMPVLRHGDLVLCESKAIATYLDRAFDGPQLIEALLPDVRAQLALLDGAVAPTNHLVGNHFTLADIYLLPMLHYLKLLPESGSMLAPSTALGRYLQIHAARPSYVRTVPPLAPPRRAAAS